MAALAEAVERRDGNGTSLGHNRLDFDFSEIEKIGYGLMRFANRKIWYSRSGDYRLPDRQRRGNAAARLLETGEQLPRITFIGQDRGKRRRIDEHRGFAVTFVDERLVRNASILTGTFLERARERDAAIDEARLIGVTLQLMAQRPANRFGFADMVERSEAPRHAIHLHILYEQSHISFCTMGYTSVIALPHPFY